MKAWVFLIALVIAGVQGITIWVQSPLTNFQKDPRLQQLLRNTSAKTGFSTFEEIHELMKNYTTSVAPNNTDNVKILIEGLFSQDSVKVSDSLSFTYAQIYQSWLSVANSNRVRLELWLRGVGSAVWVQHCIDSMDFDLLEIISIDGSKCQTLGRPKYGIDNCSLLEVSRFSRQIDGATLTFYELKQPANSNYSIVDLNHNGKVFINKTSRAVSVKANSFFEHGQLFQYNISFPLITFKRQGRIVTINSSFVVSYRQGRGIAEVYNFVANISYYGGWEHSTYHGMGYFTQTAFRYLGRFKNGMRDGKGLIVDCNTQQQALCKSMMASRRLGDGYLQTGRLFVGHLQNNLRRSGVFRQGRSLYSGKFQSYHYQNSIEGRPEIYIKLAGFALQYKISTLEVRRRGGLYLGGNIVKGIEITPVRGQNFTGDFVDGLPTRGVFYNQQETVLAARQKGDRDIVGMYFSNKAHQQIFFGRFGRDGRKVGQGTSHTVDYSYCGQHSNDRFNGYGTLTEHSAGTCKRGRFKTSMFVEGVYTTRIGNITTTSEGYFINNQTTSNSISYTSASNLLVEGNQQLQSHYIINPKDPIASKGRIVTNGFNQPYAIVFQSQF